jgi:S-adenosylmethionine/arginine decarboxylase-like enzyme
MKTIVIFGNCFILVAVRSFLSQGWRLVMSGSTRISLDLYRCRRGPMKTRRACRKKMLALVHKYGMTVLKAVSVRYPDGSFELVLILQESFVIVETWPDKRYVKAIVDICHFSRDNNKPAKLIADGIVAMYWPDKTVRKRTLHGP